MEYIYKTNNERKESITTYTSNWDYTKNISNLFCVKH